MEAVAAHPDLQGLRRKQFKTDPRAYFDLEDDPQRRAVFGATLDLLAVDSGLLWRQCYLDRRFEVLRYLLTESAPDKATGRLFELAMPRSFISSFPRLRCTLEPTSTLRRRFTRNRKSGGRFMPCTRTSAN
jgi:hypothetical protein